MWAWQHLYQNVKQQHISTRKVRNREQKLPWITKDIKKELNKRHKLLKEYKVNKNADTWQLYKMSRNKSKKMIRRAEIKYWKEQFAEGAISKKFWKVVRKAQGKDRKRQIPPIDDGSGNILVDDLAKAESKSNYFSNIGRQLAERFDTQTEKSYENVYRVSPGFSQIELRNS